MAGMNLGQQQTSSQPSTPFSLPPPPSWGQAPIKPQSQQGHKSVSSGGSTGGFGGFQAPMQPQQQQGGGQKKGLDAWESLL